MQKLYQPKILFSNATCVRTRYSRLSSALIAFLLTYVFLISSASAQMKVEGRSLYDHMGNKIVLRGMEQIMGINKDGSYIDEAAKTGANAFRICFYVSGPLTASELEFLIKKAISKKMVAFITPGWYKTSLQQPAEYLVREDIMAVLKKYEDYIIIEVIGEPEWSGDYDRWAAESKKSIDIVRNAGYKCPLNFFPTTYGRDVDALVAVGDEILNSDPLKNVIFQLQAYYANDWRAGGPTSTWYVTDAIRKAYETGLAVQIGVCAHAEGGGPVDYKAQMAEAHKYDMNYMVWAWYNPYEKNVMYNISNNGLFGSWATSSNPYGNDHGYQITMGHEASINKTAKVLPIFGPADTLPPSVPTALSSSSKTDVSVNLTWTASTDNSGANSIEYDIYNGTTKLGSSTTTSFTVIGLNPSSTYSFNVKARDLAGNSSGSSSSVSVTTNAISSTSNYAAGRVVTASSTQSGYFASDAVDNKATTRWSSGTWDDSQWIYVDLGNTYTVNKVTLSWEAAYNSGYQIQVSSNASAWTTIFSTTTGNGGIDEITGLNSSARYVRMNGTKRGTEYGTSLWEFEVYVSGGSTPGDTQAPSVPTGLASSNITSSSFTLTWTASTDGPGAAALSYEIYRGNTLAGTSETTSFNVTGLTASTAYGMTVKAKDAAGNVSAASTALSVTTSPTSTLRNPENPTNTVAGLEYKYYEGTWSTLPNFDALTAAETGNVTNFDMSVRNRNDNFGFKFTGFVNVPTDGTYTFYTSSDDGSKLYIGTTEVVSNDGLHGARERSGTIGLKAGKHAITVTFFEATGGEVLTVSYSSSGITKTAIPASALFRTGTTTGTLTKVTGTTFGTAPWSGCTTCTFDKAFDGNTATYFDASTVSGAYTGIDAGSARVVTRIRFYPRSGYLDRMVGGKFQGSNTSSSSGFVDLHTITTQPTNAWQQVDITNTTGYRYLRYLAPANSYGNIAEIEFYYTGGTSSREIAGGIETEQLLDKELKTYPNPSKENLTLEYSVNSDQKVQISLKNSMSQQLINLARNAKKGMNIEQINMSSFKSGIYFITIYKKEGRSVRKIIVNK